MIGKLMSILSIGGTVAGVGYAHRLLVAMAQIMILVVISSFMLCASLASFLYIIYFCMVQFGVVPYLACLVVGTISILTTVALVMLTLDQLRELRQFPRHFETRSKNTHDIGQIVLAFVDGFLNKKK